MKIGMGLLAMALFAAFGLSAADFTLVEKGKPAAKIVFEQKTDDDFLIERVKRFNTHLRKITGTGLPTEGSETKNEIRISIRKPQKLEQVYDWAITFPEKHVMRIEAGKDSLFAALMALLEKASDCRFLGVETCMFQYEEKNTLKVPSQPIRPAPGFSMQRNMFLIPNYAPELGLAGTPYFHGIHGMAQFAFPEEKYRKGWPEAVMPIRHGKKLKKPANLWYQWQPCYSNPETARIAAENILEGLKKNPQLSIQLGVNDCGGYCECPECTKMDSGGARSIYSNDKKNRSASYYTFVNRVANIVCKEHPDLKITVLAYIGTVMPPDFPLHPNIVPQICIDTFSGSLDPEVRKKHLDIFEQWKKKVPATGIWEYCWGRNYLIPRVNFAHQAMMMKHLHANSGQVYFGENGLVDSLDGPKVYITSRLLGDASRNVEDILNEWYTRFAGPDAEPFLRELYSRCEKFWTSPELKKTPFYSTRSYIYSYPTDQCLFGIKPGFTAGLVDLAKQVLAHARTPQQKRRAEVLLRQFEQIDCQITFSGYAYVAPENGEFRSADDVLAYLNMLEKEMPRLMEQFRRVTKYFTHADFQDYGGKYADYRDRKAFDPDHGVPLSKALLRAFGFAGDARVAEAIRKTVKLPGVPKSVKILSEKMLNAGSANNLFSNPGFARPAEETLKVVSNLPWEITSEVLCNGEKTLKLWPARPRGTPNPTDVVLFDVPAFHINQDVSPGIWAVSAKLYTPARRGIADLCLWPSLNGINQHWESLRQIPIPTKTWFTMTANCTVSERCNGVNILFRLSRFRKNEPLYLGDVRLIRIADLPNPAADGKPIKVSRIIFGSGSKRVKLNGENVIVTRSPKTYQIGRFTFQPGALKAGDVLRFKMRAALPEGCADGKIGAILFAQDSDNKLVQIKDMLWNHSLTSSFADISFSATIRKPELSAKGRYSVIFFKMKGTGGAAISQVEWQLVRKNK